MKKVLVLLSIIGVAQVAYSKPTEYKHLNKLRNYSKVRLQCELVDRSQSRDKTIEIACDTFDKHYDMYVQMVPAMLNNTSLADIQKNSPKKEDVENAAKILGVENDQNEIEYAGLLIQQLMQEEQLKLAGVSPEIITLASLVQARR